MSELWDIVCDMLLGSSRGGSAEQIIGADAEEVCQLSDRGRGDVPENFPVVNGLPGNAHLACQIILAHSTTDALGCNVRIFQVVHLPDVTRSAYVPYDIRILRICKAQKFTNRVIIFCAVLQNAYIIY